MKQDKFIKKQAKKFNILHEKKFKKIVEVYSGFEVGDHIDRDLWQSAIDIVNNEITKIRPIYQKLQHKLKCAEINSVDDVKQIDALRERCHRMKVSHREQCCQSEQEKNVLMSHCDMLEKQLRSAEKALSYKDIKQTNNAEFVSQIVDNLVKNNE